LDRRGFLKGSALLAAAVGLSVAAPAFAQDPQNKPAAPPEDEQKKDEQNKDEPKKDQAKKQDPAAKEDPNKLVDKNGREYRICERCGGNMYKEGNTWTCEQCGLSYVE
jgi:ribosomal protein S27AE